MAAKETLKRGRGRPRSDDPRTVGLRIRVTETESERFERAAEQKGQTLSAWARDTLNRVARRQGR